MVYIPEPDGSSKKAKRIKLLKDIKPDYLVLKDVAAFTALTDQQRWALTRRVLVAVLRIIFISIFDREELN